MEATFMEAEALDTALNFVQEQSYSPPATVVQADPFGGSYITAQPTPVARNESSVLAKIKARAEANGPLYYYSWEVKNKNGGKDLIEGGSIKLANDLARLYGNCVVDTRAIDCGDHWMIYARFTDLETGFSMTRPYRQRKTQNVGKGFDKSGDTDRALDMMMQIGTSKAIRNVVSNSLSDIFNEAFKAAKGAIVKRVSANPEGAKQAVITLLSQVAVDLFRAEMYIGRKADKWTVQDIAKLWSTLNSVKDGFINADDVFPPIETTEPPKDDSKDELEKLEKSRKKKAEKAESAAPPVQTPAASAEPPPETATQPVTVGVDLAQPGADTAARVAVDPETGEITDITPEVPFEIVPVNANEYDTNTVKGAVEAGHALMVLLESCPTIEHRKRAFELSFGEQILSLLGNKGQGMFASKIRKLLVP